VATEINVIEQLKKEPMNVGQWLIVLICIGALALDGYDVLSIAFAAPGMTQEWGLSKSVLGIVLSLELAGMAVGSIFLGSLADTHGRRPVILWGLVIITLGMLAAGLAPNIYVLGLARLLTGIGIGCILTTSAAIASDYCNDKNRVMAVTLVAGGFPLGIYFGASFLAPLLKQYDWRITFYLGSIMSFFFIPLIYFYVPETVSFLNRNRPPNALERIQKIMTRLGHTPPNSLGLDIDHDPNTVGLKSLFGSSLALITIILCFAYLANIVTYYYFVKWLPTLVTDLGYTASQAAEVLGIISLGGVIGAITLGLGARFIPVLYLMVLGLMLTAIGVAAFPYFSDSLSSMKLVGFLTGFVCFGATSGFFGLFAISFPSSVLGSGAGVVLGVGRAGAILGPMVPGFLFAAGLAFKSIAIIMASGSFLASLAVMFLPKRK
jgi:benzoate transport